MIKKSSSKTAKPVSTSTDARTSGQKRLEIKQIRSFVEALTALPDGAPLPDLSRLSVGDRFAIALRLVPAEERERVLGKSAAHARRYEQGTDIPLSVVSALAAETEIPVEWISTGKTMPRSSPLLVMGLAESLPSYDAGADVPVQKLAFKAAAGHGEMILDETAESIRFPSMIVNSLGVPAQNLRLFEARGESMRSTINDGDWMLVDVSQSAQNIVEGKIYVFAISDEAYVKRLRRTGGGVVMISDNRDMFPPEEVPKDAPLRIFGRVMWAGRSL